MRLTTILAAVALTGCIGTSCLPGTTRPTDGAPAGKVSYLCVGMESSERFGSCPGCAKDAGSLSALLRDKYGYEGETLISSQATKTNVVALLREGVGNTPEDGLFLFLYSGHGGQERLGGDEPDGADSPDEYLCLYDTYMLDDEIWDIVSTCRGRVFLYFDACHSATLYRSVASELGLTDVEKAGARRKKGAKALGADDGWIMTRGFTFRPENFVGATALSTNATRSVRLLCWSGCREAEYSYGSARGGTLTRSVVENWRRGKSYEALWDVARGQVVREQPGQNPVATHVGFGFEKGLEAFR